MCFAAATDDTRAWSPGCTPATLAAAWLRAAAIIRTLDRLARYATRSDTGCIAMAVFRTFFPMWTACVALATHRGISGATSVLVALETTIGRAAIAVVVKLGRDGMEARGTKEPGGARSGGLLVKLGGGLVVVKHGHEGQNGESGDECGNNALWGSVSFRVDHLYT